MHVLSGIIIAMDCSHHDSDSRPFNLSLSFYERKRKKREIELALFFKCCWHTKGRTISVELRMPQQQKKRQTKLKRTRRREKKNIHQSSENETETEKKEANRIETKRNEINRKIKRMEKMQNTSVCVQNPFINIKIAIFVRLQNFCFASISYFFFRQSLLITEGLLFEKWKLESMRLRLGILSPS